MDHLLKYAGTGAPSPTSCINISLDFSLKRQDLLPQKSGFVAPEIGICWLRNQILWSRANVGGIPKEAAFQLSVLSLQNSFPINAGNENKAE